MSKRKHQMKMIRATFRSQILKERERGGRSISRVRGIYYTYKVKKLNIGMNDNPKMESIGDYWDEKTIEKITEYCTNTMTCS